MINEQDTKQNLELANTLHGARNEIFEALDANKKFPHQSVPYFALFKFATRFDYLLMALGTIAACAHGAAMPGAIYVFGKLVDSIGTYFLYPDKLYHDACKYSLYFVYVGVVALVSAWLEVSCWTYTGERQTTRLRVEYLKALLSRDVGFFDTESSTGEVVIGFSNDTILVHDSIGEKVGNFIHHLFCFITAFSVSFSISWQLTMLTIAVVPLIALAGAAFAFTMIGLESNSQMAYAKAGEVIEQVISQIRTVYAFVGEDKAVRSYMEALQTTAKLGRKGGVAKGLGVGSVYGLSYLTWALLLWYAGHMVRSGTIKGGPAFVTIFNAIVGGLALGQATPCTKVFAKGKAAGYTILEMINQASSVHSIQDGKTLPHVVGHIQLKNIHFSYPSRPDAVIFNKFSLEIPAGKLVAIVGGSGSGKSTVISLIERFYDPQSGQVLLDGHDVRTLQLKWLRAQVGLVNQEPALFASSIKDNISVGKEDASAEQVVEAALISGAHAFINQLPMKYETQVGERGLQLSGGQKQRIALARALIRSPAILLLDEATSALDSESEKSVQDTLGQVMLQRTSVVVAHRLSTIRYADIITVVEHGRVVEIGTHDELLPRGGAYAALVKLQAGGVEKPQVETMQLSSSCRFSRNSSLTEKVFSFRLSVHSDPNSRQLEDTTEVGRNFFPRPSVWRLINLNSSEWPYCILGILGALVAGGSLPLHALGVTHVLVAFYSFIPGYMMHEIRKVAIIFCGAAVATIFFFAVEHYFFGIMGENVTLRVRKLMLSAILRNEVGWFEDDNNSSAVVASRLSSDALLVKTVVADLLCTLAHNISLLGTAYVVGFLEQWRITLVMLATYPAIISSTWAQRRFLKGFGGDLTQSYSKANKIAGEAISNIRTVAAFSAEEKVLSLFTSVLEGPRKDAFWTGQIAGICFGVSQCCMYCSYALALWYGSKLIHDGVATFSAVLKSFGVLLITAIGFAETLLLTPNIIEGMRSVGSVFDITDRKTEIDPDDPKAEVVTGIKGLIELKHVCFRYPSRPEANILEDLNLRVGAGTSLALVGASGSGKSSIIALIARFYDPLSGRIMVDGKDIRRLKLRSLRQHIGLVQQEPMLFSCSIYENILYGKEGASESEVVEAAKAANAYEFISGLPDGYRTEVGERGVQLSGGQRQRIAIARAVLKNPVILLLDEATSALDAESERAVQQAIDELMKGRTTVVVAHRLSTVRNVDAISVLADGKIAEQGRHADLLRRGGAYAKFVSLQDRPDDPSCWEATTEIS